MLKTHIEFKNGKPFISVNGELNSPLAYTTYFEECGEFSDFIKAVELCKKHNVSVIRASAEKPYFSTNELLVSSGVHCYNDKNNVVYVGEGYLGIHSVADGEIKINLPKKYKVKSLLGKALPECETDSFSLNMKKHDTVVLELI